MSAVEQKKVNKLITFCYSEMEGTFVYQLSHSTYHYNQRINPMPSWLEVSNNTKRQQFQEHLNGEHDDVEVVQNINNLLPDRILLQVDILKSQGQTGCHNEEENGPFKGSVFYHSSHSSSEAWTADTKRSAAHHTALTAIITVILVIRLHFIHTFRIWEEALWVKSKG